MDVYVFQADLLCEDCGREAIRRLKLSGKEDTGDSNDFPQGPYPDGGGEADSPNYCGNREDCVNSDELSSGHKIGAFLENPLTTEGEDYVREMHAERPTELTEEWMEFYDLEPLDGAPEDEDED